MLDTDVFVIGGGPAGLSSASARGVLEEVMKQARPKPGQWSILAAAGPGFCSELVLLRW